MKLNHHGMPLALPSQSAGSCNEWPAFAKQNHYCCSSNEIARPGSVYGLTRQRNQKGISDEHAIIPPGNTSYLKHQFLVRLTLNVAYQLDVSPQ